MAKIIAVFGATGAQGGGLARAILADPERRFAVRAVTRKPDGAAARALAGPAPRSCSPTSTTRRACVRALDGALWRVLRHQLLGALLAGEGARPGAQPWRAAAEAPACSTSIWSTLEDTRNFVPPRHGRMPVLQGKYNVPHFDAKGEANRLFADRGVPTTYLIHLVLLGEPRPLRHGAAARRRMASSAFTFPMGDAKLPGIAAEDIGKCAYGDLPARRRVRSASRSASPANT